MDCPDCNGKGVVTRKAFKSPEGIDFPEAEVSCFRCDGAGELCDDCGESTDLCEGNCFSEEE